MNTKTQLWIIVFIYVHPRWTLFTSLPTLMTSGVCYHRSLPNTADLLHGQYTRTLRLMWQDLVQHWSWLAQVGRCSPVPVLWAGTWHQRVNGRAAIRNKKVRSGSGWALLTMSWRLLPALWRFLCLVWWELTRRWDLVCVSIWSTFIFSDGEHLSPFIMFKWLLSTAATELPCRAATCS